MLQTRNWHSEEQEVRACLPKNWNLARDPQNEQFYYFDRTVRKPTWYPPC